jgi:hypothetical protein
MYSKGLSALIIDSSFALFLTTVQTHTVMIYSVESILLSISFVRSLTESGF